MSKFYALRGDTGMLGKSENIDLRRRLADLPTRADICLSMTSSVCSVTPGVTAGNLHTKVSERLTRSDVTHSELLRSANKDSEKACLRLPSQTMFTQMAILFSIHLFFFSFSCVYAFLFFLPPPLPRRCVTSARPCLMSCFFVWLWITVSVESWNLERRHSRVARKATYMLLPAKKR